MNAVRKANETLQTKMSIEALNITRNLTYLRSETIMNGERTAPTCYGVVRDPKRGYYALINDHNDALRYYFYMDDGELTTVCEKID